MKIKDDEQLITQDWEQKGFCRKSNTTQKPTVESFKSLKLLSTSSLHQHCAIFCLCFRSFSSHASKTEGFSSAAYMEANGKPFKCHSPEPKHIALCLKKTFKMSACPQIFSRFHHRQLQAERMNTLAYCRVIWPGNKCWLALFPTGDKSQILMDVRGFCLV